MLKDLIQPGDVFLVDSNKTPARIVKFFQIAPTVWHWLWREFFGTNEKVFYFHVGMFFDKNNTIEQQSVVIKRSSDKILNTGNKVFIFRKTEATDNDLKALQDISMSELNEGYDLLNILGKTLSWITGISLFGEYLQYPKAEVCVNRVAHWYREVYGEKFGNRTHSDVTTHEMYKYVKTHADIFTIVYEGIPREAVL